MIVTFVVVASLWCVCRIPLSDCIFLNCVKHYNYIYCHIKHLNNLKMLLGAICVRAIEHIFTVMKICSEAYVPREIM